MDHSTIKNKNSPFSFRTNILGIATDTAPPHSHGSSGGSGTVTSIIAGPGLTGDHKVYLGETLDLGVFVDNETIKLLD